jgi:hypothetical protein
MKIKRFNQFLLEDVGDKYAELKFNIPQKFTEFDQQYRRRYNNIGQEVIYRTINGIGNKITILKNPGTLENLGRYVRGVIDKKGNFYVEQESVLIHVGIVRILNSLGITRDPDDWYREDPSGPEIGFITVQRKVEGDMYLGESNNWYRDNREVAYPIFQKYLDNAKLKNPGINFVNKRINDW